MESNFNTWNDQLEIEGDAREEERAFQQELDAQFGELENPEEIAEYEAWLDGGEMDGDHESALESVYGPND